MKDIYVDWKKANELEGQIKDLEKDLVMARLNNRYDDIFPLKAEINELNQELEQLYWY